MYNEIMREIEVMESALSHMKERGQVLANAEKDLNIAVAKETLYLKEEGQSVTIISKLVKGKTALLQLDRDIAEVLYKTANEKIQISKYKVRIMENQYDKEYSSRNAGVGQ